MSRKKKEKKGKGVDGLLMTAHQQSQLLLVQPKCCSCRQVLCCALVVVIRLNHPSNHWVCGWVVWRSLLATRRGRKEGRGNTKILNAVLMFILESDAVGTGCDNLADAASL